MTPSRLPNSEFIRSSVFALHSLHARQQLTCSVLSVFSIGGVAIAQFSEESGPLYEIEDFSILWKAAPSLF